MSELTKSELDPAPILDAFEAYTGTITDLDRDEVCPAAMLRTHRDRLVDWTRKEGLRPGHRVILSVGNGPSFVTTLAAILTAGASPLLLHADTPPEELKRFALNFGARFIIGDGQAPEAMRPVATATAQLDLGALPTIVWSSVDENDPAFDGNFPALESVPLHPTSGTTGKPKIAVRPGCAAIADGHNYQQATQIESRDLLLCIIPMSHLYGFGTCVMLSLVSGASIVSMRRFNPRAVQRVLTERTITMFPAVPATLDLLMLASPEGLGHVPRLVLSAGAPLPERTSCTFLEKTGATITSLYGTTETGGISLVVDGYQPGMSACVGPVMKRVDVTIRKIADATDLKEGVGRVCIKSPAMMTGYLGRDGIDKSPVADGWFQSGDLGFLDDRNRIHLLSRESDVINVFGMKVIPSEVEGVIAQFPLITDVIVYAGTHRTGSQIVKAAIAAPESIDISALKLHCQRHLAPYKRPEVVVRLDALPRTPTGKIIRKQLP